MYCGSKFGSNYLILRSVYRNFVVIRLLVLDEMVAFNLFLTYLQNEENLFLDKKKNNYKLFYFHLKFKCFAIILVWLYFFFFFTNSCLPNSYQIQDFLNFKIGNQI